MRQFRTVFGLVVALCAGLMLAGCQSGAATGGGPMVSAPASSSASRGTAANTPRSATRTAQASSTSGLRSYKVYNTTESLCAQTCSSESRCVSHKFSPIQTINGYVAGQCQFFGR